MFGFLADIQPSKKKMLVDLLTFRREMEKLNLDLVPVIDEKELALISLNDIDFKKWGVISKVYKGAFTTIYHEIVFKYAIKDYFAASKRRAMYVKMAEHEFDYLTRGTKTEVFIDREHVGSLSEDGILYDVKGRKIVCQISQKPTEYQEIIIGRREVALMLNPDQTDRFNPRAFELMKDIDATETLVLLVTSIYEIIKKIIINKKIK
jgi:hypothetical protein